MCMHSSTRSFWSTKYNFIMEACGGYLFYFLLSIPPIMYWVESLSGIGCVLLNGGLGWIHKTVAGLEKDEIYIGTSNELAGNNEAVDESQFGLGAGHTIIFLGMHLRHPVCPCKFLSRIMKFLLIPLHVPSLHELKAFIAQVFGWYGSSGVLVPMLLTARGSVATKKQESSCALPTKKQESPCALPIRTYRCPTFY